MNKVKNGILAVLVSSFLLSGCGETGVQESNREEDISVSEQTSENAENYPDFNEINKITIGDRTVSLPFKAKELGDDFYADNYIDENGNVYKNDYCLYYNDTQISFVDIDNNNYITHIEFAFSENEATLPIYWSVYSFDGDSESEDVLKELGNPTNSFITDDDSNRISEMYTYIYESGVFSIYFRDSKLERILLEKSPDLGIKTTDITMEQKSYL